MFIEEFKKIKGFVNKSLEVAKREYGININIESITAEDSRVTVKATLSDPRHEVGDVNLFMYSFGEYKELCALFYKSMRYCEKRFGVGVFVDSLTFKHGKVLVEATLCDKEMKDELMRKSAQFE